MTGRIDGISDWVPPILWAALRLSVWHLAWFNYSAARLLHPEIRTYLWTKVCHGWSSKYNVPLGHHWHLENQRSVSHRAADKSYPRSTAPFNFVRVQTAQHATSAIVPWTTKFFYWPLRQKGTRFFVGCADWHPQKYPAGRRSLHWKCRFKGFGHSPNKHFAMQKSPLYIRRHCLHRLCVLSDCFFIKSTAPVQTKVMYRGCLHTGAIWIVFYLVLVY